MPTLQRGALKRRASGRSISATSSIISGPYFSTGHLPKSITMYDDGDMINPAAKSVLATSAFSLAGIISVLFYSVVSPFLLPHSIIYALLVLNTYFSIRFWSALQPQDSRQFLIDAILVLAYLALAFSIGEPTYFAFAAFALFALATFKYVLMRGHTSYEAVVERKIHIDALGALACAVLVLGMFLGYALEATWFFAVGSPPATFSLLLTRPMYRL